MDEVRRSWAVPILLLFAGLAPAAFGAAVSGEDGVGPLPRSAPKVDEARGERDRGVIVKPSQKDAPRKTRPAMRGSGWAVVIGIDDYSDSRGIGKLKYCENDARLFHDILTSAAGFPKGNCKLMLGSSLNSRDKPTRSNLYAALTSWLTLPKPEDIVVVYFAGHGIESEQRSYLLPQDARVANPELTGLPLGHVKDFLRKSKAARKVLIVDACHSGEGRDLGRMRVDWLDDSKGLVCMTSCGVGQKSYDFEQVRHGAFTWFLREGFLGAADRDGDGFVQSSELNRHVTERVKRWAAERGLTQSPRFVASVSGDPILARCAKSSRPARPGGTVVITQKDPNRFDVVLLKSGKIVECDATEIGDRVYFKRHGASWSLPRGEVREIKYGAGGEKSSRRRKGK